MSRRFFKYHRYRMSPDNNRPDRATWNVTRKPAHPSQLYLDSGSDSRRALELVARIGLPVHQVQVNGMSGKWPVLSTRHRTLLGLSEIHCWLRRLASVSMDGDGLPVTPPGKDGAG